MSTYYIPGIILGTGNTGVNKIGKIFAFMEHSI